MGSSHEEYKTHDSEKSKDLASWFWLFKLPFYREGFTAEFHTPWGNFASPKFISEAHRDQVYWGVIKTAHTRYSCSKGLMIGLGFSEAKREWIIGAG